MTTKEDKEAIINLLDRLTRITVDSHLKFDSLALITTALATNAQVVSSILEQITRRLQSLERRLEDVEKKT